jgi:hypothetical protein
MPCLARLVCEDYKLPFGDGKHYFYFESACGAGCEDDVCDKCLRKSSGPGRETQWHGLVTEPYTKKSHIFDSPWYQSKLTTYGRPTHEVLERAMEAQKKARAGKRVSVPAPPPSVQKEKPSNIKKPVVRRSPPVTPVKTTVVEQLIEPTLTSIPVSAKLVESLDESLEVSEIKRIILTKFTHNKKIYYMDKSSGSLWESTIVGSRGAFVGIWNDEDETIECV